MKIQHLDQTITMEKYPKEVKTSEKWRRGTNLCHTLTGVLWTIGDSIQPAYSLRVAVKV